MRARLAVVSGTVAGMDDDLPLPDFGDELGMYRAALEAELAER